MKLSEIRNNPDNPRVIKDLQFEKLCKSIQDFPKMMSLRPIVVDNNMMILGGNMRFKALQHLGFKEIPDEWVKRAYELTEDEARRFIIADNVSGGEWNIDDLIENWNREELESWGLELDWPVEKLKAEEDGFEIPEQIETDIVIGDLFEIGEHRLLCGDSTQADEWAKVFKNELCDLVVTDPPYNVALGMESVKDAKARNRRVDGKIVQNDKMGDDDFYQFLFDFYTALGSYTKEGGAWYVWHADSEVVNFRKAMSDAGIMPKQGLIWKKSSLVMGRQDYQWIHEPCLYGWKEGAAHNWYSDRKQKQQYLSLISRQGVMSTPQ